jgi:hypothetical protein
LEVDEELVPPPQLESRSAAKSETNTPIPLRFNIKFLLV